MVSNLVIFIVVVGRVIYRWNSTTTITCLKKIKNHHSKLHPAGNRYILSEGIKYLIISILKQYDICMFVFMWTTAEKTELKSFAY